MLSFLLAIHFVLTILIIGLILLQKHDSDGALGSSGGGAASGMFSIRGQANLLTRSTAVLMTIFILNCLLMAKIAKRVPAKESIIDRVAHESIPLKTETHPADNQPVAPANAPTTTAPAPAKSVPVPPTPVKKGGRGKKK
ncbi:MAG: preprotein translocase subunit SecG [Holosporaceae bacterium]|jgi:preprotein translocase subunit SecG|nr:preprotein translocase subunit SecG [Holosporaceae bacterium]